MTTRADQFVTVIQPSWQRLCVEVDILSCNRTLLVWCYRDENLKKVCLFLFVASILAPKSSAEWYWVNIHIAQRWKVDKRTKNYNMGDRVYFHFLKSLSGFHVFVLHKFVWPNGLVVWYTLRACSPYDYVICVWSRVQFSVGPHCFYTLKWCVVQLLTQMG